LLPKSRRWIAVAIAALAMPASVAFAEEPTTLATATALHPPLAGHPTAVRQMRAHQAAMRSARDRRRITALLPTLRQIAECESHGDPRAIGGGGQYRGAFQLTRSIWASVGGRGDPARAPLSEQYRRAAILLERSGPSQWPVCGS
jgi:Transglycosylase-like domain